MVKTNYLTFSSSRALEDFLSRKISPRIEDKIEFCVMEKFPVNRILFTAEHAQFAKIPVKSLDRGFIRVGDRNTDLLAKLTAYYLRAAYLFPLWLRTEADAARDPNELGKGLRLFVRVLDSGREYTSYMLIHKNPSYLPYLEKYHQLIEKLNPKRIISIHGMGSRRKFDILFGFGENYCAIGGKKQAFKFKDEFTNFLDKVFSQMGIKNSLEVAVSTWLFTGSRNYTLTKHIIEHNKKSKEKRIGLQVEFNLKGREAEERIPTLPYQVAVQALGDFILKWSYEF